MITKHNIHDESRTDRPSGLSGRSQPGLGPERRTSPRLASFDYVGPYAYSLTVSAARGHRPFTSTVAVRDCLQALSEACAEHRFTIRAYCFMRDHLHLLVEGSQDSSLVPFMKHFKQLSSYRHKQRTGRLLWHRSYHDHVLRKEEEPRTTAEYIWNNPIRAGLAASRGTDPFVGPREEMGPDRPEGLSVRSVATGHMRDDDL
jgi:REP-associated tyrosine transposase